MHHILPLMIAFVVSVSLSYAADISVDTFTSKDKKVVIEFFSYVSGKSGYYQVTNKYSYNAKVRLLIVNNDGKETKVSVPVEAGETTSGASYVDAGRERTGVKSVNIVEVIKAE